METDAERRLQAFARNLTLQLYLRDGTMWQQVQPIRERRGIVAVQQAELPFDPRAHRYVLAQNFTVRPPDEVGSGQQRWQAELHVGQRTCEPEEEGWAAYLTFLDELCPKGAEGWLAYAAFKHRWQADLNMLHDRVIPSEHWIDDRSWSRKEWQGFLALCIQCDPPPMRLLEFARWGIPSPIAEYDPDTVQPGPAICAPPIVHIADPEKVRKIERWRYEQILAELGRRCGVPTDQWEALVQEVAHSRVLMKEYVRQLEDNPPARYIRVGPYTTLEDTKRAHTVLASTQEGRIGRGRGERDPLTAVQCAIMAAGGQSVSEIARHFGWKLRADDYGKRRISSIASDHIKLGRAILAKKKPAE